MANSRKNSLYHEYISRSRGVQTRWGVRALDQPAGCIYTLSLAHKELPTLTARRPAHAPGYRLACQWPEPRGSRRARHAAPLCAAQRPRPHLGQVRLRRGTMRRLHRAGGWPAAALLSCGRGVRAGATDHHAGGPRRARGPRSPATGLCRRGGGAMRLLHPGPDRGGPRASQAPPPAHR